MKKMAILTMAVILLVAATVSAQPVVFADANLKAAVEGKLGVSDPTPTDMLGLTDLYASNIGITDLTGLEYGVNLTKLRLYRNQISDISPLSGLTKLTELHLDGNQISDISPISGLTNLWELDLDLNQISDIGPISELTNLTNLHSSENQISDISPISELTNLTELTLYDNQISDITPLDSMTNLWLLWLWGNPLNCDAYRSVIPSIITNNPGIDIRYDPKPPECSAIAIVIDIKPGSYPNTINKNGKGVIPVAILGSADFDVTQIDVSTLSFEGMAVRIKGNDRLQCSVEDVSGDFSTPEGAPDGYLDLVCQFVDDTSSWTMGDGEATLTGLLLDGTPFEGTDSIKVVQ